MQDILDFGERMDGLGPPVAAWQPLSGHATEDMFKQVIEVKDTLDNELHRKISATLEPVSFEDETTGRN